jgi:hypothetical protein
MLIFVEASECEPALRPSDAQERPRNAAMPDLVTSVGMV